MAETSPHAARRTIALERFYDAPVETVWELWTTKAGIESWWGPAGFSTEVTAIDVRPGGHLVVEIGAGQGPAAAALAAAAGLQEVKVVPDLAGRHRVLTARRPPTSVC